MDPISLIVSGAGSIAGIALSGLASKVFKREKGVKLTIRFKDGQTSAVELSPEMDQDERERVICQTIEQKTALSALETYKKYLFEAILAVAIFGVFVSTSIVMHWLGKLFHMLEFAIVFRIIGLTISVLGAICCIAFVVRNTVDFIKFLMKGPPQG